MNFNFAGKFMENFLWEKLWIFGWLKFQKNTKFYFYIAIWLIFWILYKFNNLRWTFKVKKYFFEKKISSWRIFNINLWKNYLKIKRNLIMTIWKLRKNLNRRNPWKTTISKLRKRFNQRCLWKLKFKIEENDLKKFS